MQANMSTLYVRNLPDDVTAKLREAAKLQGMSLNALAVRELTLAARTADNAALIDELHRTLPDLDVSVDDILQGLDEARAAR